MTNDDKNSQEERCPKCAAPLGEVNVTRTGRKLQRCSKGSWDSEAKKNVGCDFIKWFPVEDVPLDEKCPKCNSPLILATTRFGKKMKKCSTGKWDSATKKVVGCDFVEWINGTTEPIDEDCPECGAKLVLFTTNNGKKMKKCSTADWDPKNRKATGCTYVYWLKSEYPKNETYDSGGEEFLPPEPEEELN